MLTRHLLGRAEPEADEVRGGVSTLIERCGSAASLNIHLHCLVLDGAYRRGADGEPVFVEGDPPAMRCTPCRGPSSHD